MKIKALTNIKIIQNQDRNLNTYYLIFNQDSTEEAYFCFANTVKEGWPEFQDNWASIQKIELEYEETEKGNKVINILSHDQSGDIFV
ncbi:hypothetical protein [endosymbiont GvMRE of Glomus versiforme]|uniref:hypothetical protein n=1 Tax=endosymbiont GvMRE of Glomus versiforme TaxID=2039283 RepID=UPI0011C36DEF|nr:hypothetical protein [endosymbiont GvMRE of Glomus versiforme]